MEISDVARGLLRDGHVEVMIFCQRRCSEQRLWRWVEVEEAEVSEVPSSRVRMWDWSMSEWMVVMGESIN